MGLQFPTGKFTVAAVITLFIRGRNFFTIERLFDIEKRPFHPRIITLVWYERDLENKFAVKSFFGATRVAVYEISGRRNGEAVLAEKPLIYFHLPFVPIVPIFVERFYLLVFTRRFVIHDDQIA